MGNGEREIGDKDAIPTPDSPLPTPLALIVRRIAVTLRAHAFQFRYQINPLSQGEEFQ